MTGVKRLTHGALPPEDPGTLYCVALTHRTDETPALVSPLPMIESDRGTYGCPIMIRLTICTCVPCLKEIEAPVIETNPGGLEPFPPPGDRARSGAHSFKKKRKTNLRHPRRAQVCGGGVALARERANLPAGWHQRPVSPSTPHACSEGSLSQAPSLDPLGDARECAAPAEAPGAAGADDQGGREGALRSAAGADAENRQRSAS